MAIVYFDCFAGISGNMLLGALLDAGLPEETLRQELAKLPVEGYDLHINKVVKSGVSAMYVDVHLNHHHDHNHINKEGAEHHHHHHRNLPDILKIIDSSTLDEKVKQDSKRVFIRLAEAEAKVHGTTSDKIHFHEVGAVDAIIDIIGTVFGLSYLGVEQIYASKLRVGTGFIKCSHGLMPIPAPATAELLQGIPYYAGEIAKEMVTPTGAAILSTLGTGFGVMPEGFISQKISYGAGTWDTDIPNVLRMHLGEIPVNRQTNDDLILIETNIDDTNPQVYGYVMDKLFSVGALDVWLTNIIMKKGRPAVKLSVLTERQYQDEIAAVLFNETSTIGIRFQPVGRVTADRQFVTVTSEWGDIKVKVSSYKNVVCSTTPEYEDCRQAAVVSGVPLKDIQQSIWSEAQRLYKKL